MTEQSATGALQGLLVIDASRVLGGPYCGQILGDHGARVIKVEPPQGDETRLWGPPFHGDGASYYQGLNRNKEGIALDFSREEGREFLMHLLEGADVFIENFKTGTLEKWGIGREELRKRFPRLVHARVSGFGEDGPYGGRPGYDAAIQALVGIMSVNGEAGGKPQRVGVPVVDMVTGLNAALGIMLALQERHRSGLGQFVEASLYDCGFSLMHPHLPNMYLGAPVPGRSGNAHPNITPYDTYAAQDGDVFLAVGNNGQFANLCKVLGLDDMPADERFSSNANRKENRPLLRERLEAAMSSWTAEAIAEKLITSGVPAAPVRTLDQVIADPHTHARKMIVDTEGVRGTASPIKLERTPATYRKAPPAFGQHTDQVTEEFGLTGTQAAEGLVRR
ncbi:CaiB/BaiF CoA transferase family protein [Falsigemmobacter faecalis]|uniref:CoA transferase n=1 Tax=Falsigemmobacter faecalis TaxID=2488730 RepID=A0A3P3DV84_9RHOB|nr:CaiB/BaiF CoA-transferase family protein [Falsigemmobacter faecalis]RRH76608.1 CoA transferase [Falsigemmobacter faecalis]